MTTSRRDFIKFIVAGSVAAGCPLEHVLPAAPPEGSPALSGERFEICHQVRDGHRFARPAVSRRCDVVIVGGGISGLSAAYFLQNYDFLLLEKEDHWGGNAYVQEFRGQAFATGSAFEFADGEGTALARELGLQLLPVNCPDATIVNGVFIADTWRKGLDQLPYPAAVRESFKKFRRAALAVDVEKRAQELDNTSFSRFLAAYAPEVTAWWDAYGPSNWGARAAESCALVGIEALHFHAGEESDLRVTLPGGLGAISRRLADFLLRKSRERMLSGATVLAVEQQKSEVRVTFLRGAQPETIAAKAVIMAAPKFIAARVVAGIPPAQRAAMRKIRYAPYPVVNIIYDRPVFNRAYDTWAPGKSFTDLIVADWTVRNQPGYRPKHNILTCYTPMRESQRALLQVDGACRQLAARVLRDCQSLLPEFKVDPVEVHIYRRGHPMFMATPGNFTRTLPAARRPLPRVFFANADSNGPESLTSNAVSAARLGADWLRKLFAGGTRGEVLKAAAEIAV